MAKPLFENEEPMLPLEELIAPGEGDKTVNSKLIVCKRCGSKIIKPGMAELVGRERELPNLAVSKEALQAGDPEKSAVTDCWMLRDMMKFENVGFTNAVDGTRYLTCADCDLGPIGWHEKGVAPPEYLVGIDRASYK